MESICFIALKKKKREKPTNLTGGIPAFIQQLLDLGEVEHGLPHVRDVHFLQALL